MLFSNEAMVNKMFTFHLRKIKADTRYLFNTVIL